MIDSKRVVSVRDNALLSMSVLSFSVTANELAVEVMRLEGVRISSVPKRIPEMKKYGHIESVERRPCRVTGENAWAFRVTALGLEHLRKKGLFSGGAVAVVPRDSSAVKPRPVAKHAPPPSPIPSSKVVSRSSGRAALSGLKSILN